MLAKLYRLQTNYFIKPNNLSLNTKNLQWSLYWSCTVGPDASFVLYVKTKFRSGIQLDTIGTILVLATRLEKFVCAYGQLDLWEKSRLTSSSNSSRGEIMFAFRPADSWTSLTYYEQSLAIPTKIALNYLSLTEIYHVVVETKKRKSCEHDYKGSYIWRHKKGTPSYFVIHKLLARPNFRWGWDFDGLFIITLLDPRWVPWERAQYDLLESLGLHKF